MTSIEPLWSQHAFGSPRALGPVLGSGLLRAHPEDFLVEEELGFAPAGTGQHVLLKVRKRDANTQWVARELAKVAGCRPMDVGYAGLKDRRAVAIQWFSVPRPPQRTGAWPQTPDGTWPRTAEFEVLEAYAHTRKLPRGALAGNSFTIRIRELSAGDLTERIRLVSERGVPNYFGPQRFGREGSNLVRINAGLGALRPQERGFVLSAARSLIFNAVLAERVRDGSWEHLEPGDVANLDGSGSVFRVEAVDATLRERCQRLDIHPTGPMWGRGQLTSQGRIAEVESKVSAQLPAAVELVERAGMEQERRSLRMAVRNVTWAQESATTEVPERGSHLGSPPRLRSVGGGVGVLRFRLSRGSFATTVLREILDVSGEELEG